MSRPGRPSRNVILAKNTPYVHNKQLCVASHTSDTRPRVGPLRGLPQTLLTPANYNLHNCEYR